MNALRLKSKMNRLIAVLEQYDSLIVAFSGGVDSSFLLAVAHGVLGAKVWAVTAESPVHPPRESKAAAEFARKLGVAHIVLPSREMSLPGFVANARDRCYICKKQVLGDIIALAAAKGVSHVAHGANVDDLGDFRPGFKAAAEMGVVAPLIEAGLAKNEIRQLSKAMHLNTWDKPAIACLASRIPYGTPITRQALQMVAQAEDFILRCGFKSCRVRHHGEVARIELAPTDLPIISRRDMRRKIVRQFKAIGFVYVTVDLEGYRQGSLNRAIEN
ncbi:MAG: ATP-dependent sacrificial sulfur transferase LarE [Desulfobacterales bacterium]|nr:MAG: ATP-dependent sacrificial sulfur transferase LarE [Desulfobacterales bacterium]